MIIGLTHIDENPNHELVKLFGSSQLFQTETLLGDAPLVDQTIDLLQSISDRVICYGNHTGDKSIEYKLPLIQDAKNAASIFHVCRKNRADTIVYVPSHICSNDWHQLRQDIQTAIDISMAENKFVVLTTERWTAADPELSWCSKNHYVANLQGLDRSLVLLDHAKDRAAFLFDQKYKPATGICVFPSKRVFDILKQTMPTYYRWVLNSHWSEVCRLTFEQAILENIMEFETVHTKTLTMPINHYYQMFHYLRQKHGLLRFEPDWNIFSNNGQYEIAIRHINSHQTNVELVPGVYFKHNVKHISSHDDFVFEIKEKTYSKFEYNIDLMRIRKLIN